ncbi:reverse transcriptase domain-containing protein [Tanacetum coccineum]
MNTASSSGTGSLPSNTVANPKGELKAITTRSGLVLDEPSVPIPPPFINPEEDERVEETFTDSEHGEFTIKFTFPADFVIVDYESDPRVPFILGRPFLRTARAFIDVHGEEMILRDGNERLILNMRKDTSSYSNEPHQESINMIDIYNVSHEEIQGDMEEFKAYLASDSFPPGNDDLVKAIPEEFADELALIDSFPPGNDDMTLEDVIKEVKCLRELEYLLNHDPIKDMDSILEDSVDENSLDDNLDDTISEMFTDEHALDYSSPPLWDDYDDDLFDHDTVNDDPFDFKEEKIKDSKILIDELDLPESNNVLPFLECDSVFYEDFSEDDALSSTNNEDKVFNPGILIHENLFEVTNFTTPEKNVKKATNASLILEDFNPPLSLYELPFHKEVPGLGALLSFSPENEEKVYNPGILTSKRVHTSLLPELSHRGTKTFKVTKILESPMEIFPCSYQEDIRVLDVPCLHFYPP